MTRRAAKIGLAAGFIGGGLTVVGMVSGSSPALFSGLIGLAACFGAFKWALSREGQ